MVGSRGVYDPTLRFEMQMVKVVYRRHGFCDDEVSHARDPLEGVGEVDMLSQGVEVASHLATGYRAETWS
jgi:hypothetical protein